MRGFRKSSKAQGASRVEPRILRPMHYKSSAWDFFVGKCLSEMEENKVPAKTCKDMYLYTEGGSYERKMGVV